MLRTILFIFVISSCATSYNVGRSKKYAEIHDAALERLDGIKEEKIHLEKAFNQTVEKFYRGISHDNKTIREVMKRLNIKFSTTDERYNICFARLINIVNDKSLEIWKYIQNAQDQLDLITKTHDKVLNRSNIEYKMVANQYHEIFKFRNDQMSQLYDAASKFWMSLELFTRNNINPLNSLNILISSFIDKAIKDFMDLVPITATKIKYNVEIDSCLMNV